MAGLYSTQNTEACDKSTGLRVLLRLSYPYLFVSLTYSVDFEVWASTFLEDMRHGILQTSTIKLNTKWQYNYFRVNLNE